MDVTRWRPSRAASRRKRDHQSPDYGRHDSQNKDRKINSHASAQPLANMDAPFRFLKEVPVPRSREKNDQVVQSWLQQTQARHSRLPDPDYDEGRFEAADRSRSKPDINKHGKRPRSLSDYVPPSPKAAAPVEHRFEKRARHKTRSDKYDYKAGVGHKHVSD